MENTSSIGRIASPSSQVAVERAGEQLTLKQGDPVFAGDVLQNKDQIAVDIELPARASGQADSLITLAPESAARLDTIVGADGVSEQIEVSALTDGVELYALGEGENSAILLADAGGEFQGLVGAGLLASGGVSTTAAAVGGGLGLAALASTDGSSASASINSEVEFDDNQDTGNPDDQPEDQNPPTENENPDSSNNDSGGGAAGGLNSLSTGIETTGDQLGDGQLSPATDAVSFLIAGDTSDSTVDNAASDPTGGQLSDAGFNGVSGILITAATEIGEGGSGTPIEPLSSFLSTAINDDTPSDRPDGAAGTLSAVSQGIYTGAQGTGAEPVVDPLTALLGYDGDGHTDGVAESLTYLANTLSEDAGPFEPVLAPLAPTIGTGEGDYDSSGLAGTTQEIAEGIYDLGQTEGSALSEAAPLTDGIAFIVGGEEVSSDPSGMAPSEISGGVSGTMKMLGHAIKDNNPFSDQDMGMGDFLGSLMGGKSKGTISSSSSNGFDELDSSALIDR